METQLPRPVLLEVAHAGIQAPSADNGQPWRLDYVDGRLLVAHDPARALRYDRRFRASLIAVGCLVENVVVTASAAGYGAEVECLPEGAVTDPVAVLTFRPDRARAGALLAPLVFSRTTNRKPYRPARLAAGVVEELMRAVAEHPGVRLDLLVDRPAMRGCARLAMRADRFRYTRRTFHEELFRAIRFADGKGDRMRDGLAVGTLELGPLGERVLRYIEPWPRAARLHRFGLGRAMAGLTYVSVIRAGGVAVLRTAGSGPLEAVRLGRALEQLWLQLTRLGLAAQPLSVGTLLLLDLPGVMAAPLDTLRRELDALVPGPTGLSVLLRVGVAPPPSQRSLRRPVGEILKLGPV